MAKMSCGSEAADRSSKYFTCVECGAGFLRMRALNRHYNTHTKCKMPCAHCQEKFSSTLALKIHILKHHNAAKLEGGSAAKVRKFVVHNVCPQCGLTFTEPTIVDAHIAAHVKNGDTSWLCGCGMKFNTNAELSDHISRNPYHLNHTYYKCPSCGDNFFTFSLLMKHVNSAHASYICSECNGRFSSAICLKSHKITHGQEKQFRCSQCDAGFHIMDDFTIHIREVHCKDLICQNCGKGFSGWKPLWKHIQVFHSKESQVLELKTIPHMSQKPQTSSDCGSIATDDGSRTVPKPTHSKETQCTQCGEVFTPVAPKEGAIVSSCVICPPCAKDFKEMFGIDLDQ